MNHQPPPGNCERIGLLLSLRADDAATPQQLAEIDAHLPGCAACRRAAAVDVAVRGRIVELTTAAPGPAPAWLDGFAARTTSKAVALAREARSQNRLLLMSAAAAVLVALTAQFAWPGRDAVPAPSGETAALREAARSAVMRPPRLVRNDEGK
jgi:predicted anti-sigma-YlaC factor YlaD